MDNDEIIAQHLVFSYEATFHTGGKVNGYNLRMCGNENHMTVKH
jgi:hypothetical protein